MSLIRSGRTSSSVMKFFFKELMPLAEQLRGEGKAFFPLKGDPGAETYYIRRDKTTIAPEDFEVVGCDAVEGFQDALVDLWTSQGYPQLTALAPTLSRLARSLYRVEEQSEEVSPFIYVMF